MTEGGRKGGEGRSDTPTMSVKASKGTGGMESSSAPVPVRMPRRKKQTQKSCFLGQGGSPLGGGTQPLWIHNCHFSPFGVGRVLFTRGLSAQGSHWRLFSAELR